VHWKQEENLFSLGKGEYITQWAEVEFLPDSLKAITCLHRFGFKVIIVTNQRGVATGKIPIANLEEIHRNIRLAIADNEGYVSDIYCCTQNISESCFCRKPKPEMLFRATKEFSPNLFACWIVDDTTVDIEAGKRAGCKTALITQAVELTNVTEKPDVLAQSLMELAQQILVSWSAATEVTRLRWQTPACLFPSSIPLRSLRTGNLFRR
jgi:histidinol-phosphate phosphatase family protein